MMCRCRSLGFSVVIAITFAHGVAGAASPAEGVITVTSHTGHFIVTGKPLWGVSGERAAQMAASKRLELAPNVAAASCERIAAALSRRLQLPERWPGRVAVALVNAPKADLKARITATRYRDGWSFRLDVLNPVDAETFVRAVVQLLLTEFGNRNADGRVAEIPLWLVHGIAAELLAWDPELALRPGVRVSRETRGLDPVEGPRRLLAQRPALTFDQLSWPGAETLTGERQRLFDASAHLLVNQLFHLPDGPQMMRRYLVELPQHLNWQIAFLRGYEKQFQNLLDVEKWWAVNLAAFTGRNQWQMWPAATALDRLRDALRVEVELRRDARELPEKRAVTLQAVIENWTYTRQHDALRGVLGRLAVLRAGTPPELLRLLDAYRGTIESYLAKRPTTGLNVVRGVAGSSATRLAWETARRLDALDAERERMRNASTTAQTP